MKSPKSFGKPKRPKLFLIRRIAGNSMLPAYRPDQIVLAIQKRPRPGDVVVFVHQNLEKIKRVSDVREAEVYLLGDNSSQSTDSRSFGWLPMKAVSGVVIWPRR